jgi:AcrR family transcriptional regulator
VTVSSHRPSLTHRPSKGDATRAVIVEAAVGLAQRHGLEGLTIGTLAEQLGKSKSGVFAHFGSREELQLAVLREYAAFFVERVLKPAVNQARGLPRFEAIVDNWLALLAEEVEAGCILIGGASEYDDRPGPLRDAMVKIITGWKAELLTALTHADDAGQLIDGTDRAQIVFEIYGLMLSFHQDARLLRGKDSLQRARAGIARLIASIRRDAPGVKATAVPVRNAANGNAVGASAVANPRRQTQASPRPSPSRSMRSPKR